MGRVQKILLLLAVSGGLGCADAPPPGEAGSSPERPAAAAPDALQGRAEVEFEWIPGSLDRSGQTFLMTNVGAEGPWGGTLEVLALNANRPEPRVLETIQVADRSLHAGETAPIEIPLSTDLQDGDFLVARPMGDRELLPRLRDKSVVRVLLYGAVVFEQRNNLQDSAPEIVAHFPIASGHTIEIAVGQRKGTRREWTKISTDGGLDRKFIVFKFGGGKLVRDTTTLNTSQPPTSANVAKHPGWLLTEREIEGGTDLSADLGTNALGHVLLDDGTFETCGLVYGFAAGSVCTVKVGDRVQRPMAELMVLRKEDPDPVEIHVCDVDQSLGRPEPVNCARYYEVQSTGRCSLAHSECFDVAVRHVPPTNGRVKATTHTTFLATLFNHPTNSQWYKATAEYCLGAVQPDCFAKHYHNFGGSHSSYDRPICPFVENQ